MGAVKIFSRAIRTGKTTELMEWCKMHHQADGILMPDVNDVRNFYFINSSIYLPAQVDRKANEEKISVGKFCFSKKAFDSASAYLEKNYTNSKNYFIIDEIGKLEVEQQTGLHHTLVQILQIHLNQPNNTTLLLVVRENLLNNFLENYMHECKVEISDKLDTLLA
ncbi:MAG: hypothetical protein IPO27_02595 [Bacteroidetes bacterium]|nr:hypothetical protein [Bacteroidota bacterium]